MCALVWSAHASLAHRVLPIADRVEGLDTTRSFKLYTHTRTYPFPKSATHCKKRAEVLFHVTPHDEL